MKCEKCNEREATVYLEQSINGESRSMHLCHECAAKLQGELDIAPFHFGNSLFENLFGLPKLGKVSGTHCPGCGASFADIRREGKVCCPACYAAFSAELEPSVRSLHGSVTHTGRAPAKRAAKREKQSRLQTLKGQLQEAIQNERYEDAARLRDEIRTLEKEGE